MTLFKTRYGCSYNLNLYQLHTRLLCWVKVGYDSGSAQKGLDMLPHSELKCCTVLITVYDPAPVLSGTPGQTPAVPLNHQV